MTFVTSDTATGMRHNGVRWPHGAIPPPFGCRRCGYPENQHGLGAHQWERPTNVQILARMRARRIARLLPPIPLEPDPRCMVTLSARTSDVAQVMRAAFAKLATTAPTLTPGRPLEGPS